MKNILLNIMVFCLFAISSPATANTEAKAPCFNCLITQNPLKSFEEVQKLCMQSLPEYCHNIKPKYTLCTPNIQEGTTTQYIIEDVGQQFGSCAMGVYDGATDLFTGTVDMVKGAGKFVVDSAYRKEALNTMSYMAASVADASASDVKDFFCQSGNGLCG